MSPHQDYEANVCPATVDLVFKVWAPNLNRSTHRLYLLGSIKAMGAWNLQTALEAYPTIELHTWKVEIRSVPAKSSFEWSWLRAKPDKTDVKWERMVKRNRTVDCFSGIIHTIFGDGEEVFIQAATQAEISTYRKVEDTQVMVLTGCSQTTGNWDLKHAVKAVESPRQSGYWKVQVSFDTSSTLLFKWAIVREKDRKLHMIEKESHALYGRQAWIRAVAPWNMPHMFIEDTPICLEPLDNMNGRTDVVVGSKKIRNDVIRRWLKTDSLLNTPNLVPINQVPNPKPPTQTHATPRKTNPEKAKEAFKAMMTSPQQNMVAGASAQARVPTVHTLDNVDDHVKKRSEAIHRQTKQQFPEAKVTDETSFIKGKGQTLVRKNSGQSMPSNPNSVGLVLEKSHVGSKDNNSDHSRFLRHEDSGFETGSQVTEIDFITYKSERSDSCDKTCVSKSTKILKVTGDNTCGFESDPASTDVEDTTLSQTMEVTEEIWEIALSQREKMPPKPQNEPDAQGFFPDEDEYLQFLTARVEEDESIVNTNLSHSMKTFPQQPNPNKWRLQKYEEISQKPKHKPGYDFLDTSTIESDDDGTSFVNLGKKIETLELQEKRSRARILEQQWGSFSTDDKIDTQESLLHQLVLSSGMTFAPSPSRLTLLDGGYSELVSSGTKEQFRMAQYSNTELANATMPLADDVDRRAIARMLETKWGTGAKGHGRQVKVT